MILGRFNGIVSAFVMAFAVLTAPTGAAGKGSSHVAADLIPYDLRCDDAVQPIGLDSPRPRLSWRVEQGQGRGARSRRQTAYRILVASDARLLSTDRGDLWDSGKRPTSRLPYVVYAGKPLRSRQRVYWKVRTWDEHGVMSPWSTGSNGLAAWEMGLMHAPDWRARWITARAQPPATEREMFGDDPAPLLRKEFAVTRPVASARIYLCGLGYYELHLNGMKVGDHVLDPGWTSYAKRALYITYDVTQQLRRGGNALGVMLGNGWYNPLPLRMWGHLNLREHLTIGQPRLIAQLEITYADGTRQTVCTDETWRRHDGPIVRNSVYLGEVYDARRELPGWDRPGLNDSDWQPALPAREPMGPLCAQTAPPIRVTRTVRPVKITHSAPDVAIVDMGQNFAGWVRLRVRGPEGTRVTMRYGELLYPNGSLNPMTSVTGQIKGQQVEPGSEAPSTAWQRDIYILKGAGEEVYTPRFTFHGFRYVEVSGFPGPLTPDSLTGLRLNSDVAPAGTFECSNPLFNRIQEMTRWTEQSNLFSVQSDCPHREKLGYGGDIVATSEMAMLNYDMSRFYAKVVQDYSDSVRPNGGFTETAPYVGIADAGLGGESGPVEWGTAHPLLLLQLYRYYGNRALIEAQYPKAQAWMRLLQSRAVDDILDNGIGDHEGLHRPPTALTGTAFYYANAAIMAQLAEALGRRADAAEYHALALRIKAAFQKRFDPDGTGRFAEAGESSQAFALYFDLVAPQERDSARATLTDEVLVKNDGHLDTGIFGTKFLLAVLSDLGRADVAAGVVNQTSFPGWGYMLAHGGTTLWEHWEFSDNTFSHNHPMFGSVSEWFYKSLAGIAPAPDAVGFDRILIHPHPVPGLTWARGRYRSVRGLISTDWAQRPDGFHLTVTIPPDASALVTLPASSWQTVKESGQAVDRAGGVSLVRKERGELTVRVGSGTYRFVSR